MLAICANSLLAIRSLTLAVAMSTASFARSLSASLASLLKPCCSLTARCNSSPAGPNAVMVAIPSLVRTPPVTISLAKLCTLGPRLAN